MSNYWNKVEELICPEKFELKNIEKTIHKKNLKITIGQLNFKVGDFENNNNKIMEAINEAHKAKSDLVIFSEMSLSGYYPWDLIERDLFWQKQEKSLNKILKLSQKLDIHIVLGLARKNNAAGKKYLNSLVVIYQGKIIFDYDKKLLPTYNVFDEKRHFEEGNKIGVWEGLSTKIGFFICEDGWNDGENEYHLNPINELVINGAELLIGINASPSNIYKMEKREEIFKKIAVKYRKDIIYVNQVGAQDSIVFDGGSFFYNHQGESIYQAPQFKEIVKSFYLNDLKQDHQYLSKEEFIFEQVCLGLSDYLRKNGFKKVVVGSSGGIDSALTLAIATLTLGYGNVTAIGMPGPFSSEGSIKDSIDLCKKLNIKFILHPISDQFGIAQENYLKNVKQEITGLAKENLQARIRGQILMTFSNQNNAMVLSTGNKSETSVGYCTLYGDSNGGLNLLGDLYKMEVYALAKFINKRYGKAANDHSGNLIPESIINKAPSAELAPDQKDEDNLPPYDILDTILYLAIEGESLNKKEKINLQKIVDSFEEKIKLKVYQLIDNAEYKRQQSPPIIRVHQLAFGVGRRIPIAHGLKF